MAGKLNKDIEDTLQTFVKTIAEHLEGRILTNIKEVAKLAGVSASTVSRVLTGNIPVAEDTKERVLEAVKQLNYQPNVLAQGLKGARIKTIGLIIPNVRNLVFPAAIRGIEDTANQHGYSVVLCNTDESVEKEKFYIDSLRRRLIDGFIFSTARPGYEHIDELKREGFPVVSLLRHHGNKIDAIVLDNFTGAYEATRYMLSRGLKRLAFINGWMDITLYQQRFKGFQKAMEDAGVKILPDLVVHNIDGWEDGYQAMASLLASGRRIDGVFAASDPKALGVIRAIKDFGLSIPDDISVMGFDNLDLAPLADPPLTTVAQPFYEMGAKACERLIHIIEANQKPKARLVMMPPELVIRKSVR